MEAVARDLRACGTCGLVQRVAPIPKDHRAMCPRCKSVVARSPHNKLRGANTWTAATALAALLLYPLAILLPFLSVERLGHHHAGSILESGMELLFHGEVFIGITVLLCSVVFPLAKLTGLLLISTSHGWMKREHLARTWHAVELVGRWGMLDVLLAAVLVAMLKLGDLVTVEPGPGLVAFTACVGLSLLASAFFDPHALWETE
ncbi:MAG: paraquat-inducible protein A [Bacteroidia bacterium]|jgi:paraquat-inducible protein A